MENKNNVKAWSGEGNPKMETGHRAPFEVTRNRKILSPDMYEWNEEFRFFICYEAGIQVDALRHNGVTIYVGDDAKIIAGNDCVLSSWKRGMFEVGNNCKVNGHQGCIIHAGNNCAYETDDDVIFRGGKDCYQCTDD